jgi:hypothetical protein
VSYAPALQFRAVGEDAPPKSDPVLVAVLGVAVLGAAAAMLAIERAEKRKAASSWGSHYARRAAR